MLTIFCNLKILVTKLASAIGFLSFGFSSVIVRINQKFAIYSLEGVRY